jgi:hypothetical protein
MGNLSDRVYLQVSSYKIKTKNFFLLIFFTQTLITILYNNTDEV